MEPYLSPLVQLMEHAYRVLSKEGEVRHYSRLVPEEMRADARVSEHVGTILVTFGVAVPGRRSLLFPLRGLSKAEREVHRAALRRRVRLYLKQLQILAWQITAKGFFEPNGVAQSKAEIGRFFREFGISTELYECFVVCLSWLGIADRRQGPGGLALRYPAQIEKGPVEQEPPPPRNALVTLPLTRISSVDQPRLRIRFPVGAPDRKFTGEYSYYASLVRFFETPSKHLRDADRWKAQDFEEHMAWTTACVMEGGAAPLPISKWTETNALVNASRGSNNALGDWRNPDILGYRLTSNEVFGTPALEVLAVEIKGPGGFMKDSVMQTAAYLEFANISYLAVPDTFASLSAKKLVMGSLMQTGIGLLCVKTAGAQDWYEAVPPRFHSIRRQRTTSLLLRAYFGENGVRAMRREFRDALFRILEDTRETTAVG